jgi:hypothetical protein
MAETKAVGQMNASELAAHIKAKDEAHRREMTHLRALLRCLPADEKKA